MARSLVKYPTVKLKNVTSHKDVYIKFVLPAKPVFLEAQQSYAIFVKLVIFGRSVT